MTLLRAALAVAAIAGLAALAPGCKPDLDDRPSRVIAPRVLAITSEPAEAKPSTRVKYTILWAAPDGAAAPAIGWAFCRTPKLLSEDAAVSPECARGAGVLPLPGDGLEIAAETPADACALFGPDVPAGEYRPRDPDPTGGFYQPVLAAAAGERAFGFHRIRCNLAGASADVVSDFGKRYRPNENPRLADVVALDGDRVVPWDALPAGGRVTLRASWDPGAQETFAWYDPRAERIVDRRESLRVSWFASGGELDLDRTGRGEDEATASSDDGFAVPASGAGRVWVVLRDSRGGASFLSRAFSPR